MAMDNGSMQALFGGQVHALGTVTDGDSIKFPAGASVVSMTSSATSTGHTLLKVPGIRKGSLVRIDTTGAVKFVNTNSASVSAHDQMDLGGSDLTLGADDSLYLQRWEVTVSGVEYRYWRVFLNVNR